MVQHLRRRQNPLTIILSTNAVLTDIIQFAKPVQTLLSDSGHNGGASERQVSEVGAALKARI